MVSDEAHAYAAPCCATDCACAAPCCARGYVCARRSCAECGRVAIHDAAIRQIHWKDVTGMDVLFIISVWTKLQSDLFWCCHALAAGVIDLPVHLLDEPEQTEPQYDATQTSVPKCKKLLTFVLVQLLLEVCALCRKICTAVRFVRHEVRWWRRWSGRRLGLGYFLGRLGLGCEFLGEMMLPP